MAPKKSAKGKTKAKAFARARRPPEVDEVAPQFADPGRPRTATAASPAMGTPALAYIYIYFCAVSRQAVWVFVVVFNGFSIKSQCG